jgi:hypothetical protein
LNNQEFKCKENAKSIYHIFIEIFPYVISITSSISFAADDEADLQKFFQQRCDEFIWHFIFFKILDELVTKAD